MKKKNLATVVTPGDRYENGGEGTNKGAVKRAFYSFLYFIILFCFCDENMFMYYWLNFKIKPKQNDTGL